MARTRARRQNEFAAADFFQKFPGDALALGEYGPPDRKTPFSILPCP